MQGKRMTNDEWRMANGKWQMTNDKWQMTNGKWQMANNYWQMTSPITLYDTNFPNDPKWIYLLLPIWPTISGISRLSGSLLERWGPCCDWSPPKTSWLPRCNRSNKDSHPTTTKTPIEQGLAPYHDQDPERRNWSTPKARAQCAQQAEACQQLLSEVMELERQNEQNMIARRDQVAAQLQAAQAAGAARGAYQAHQRSTPQGPHQTQTTRIAPLADDSPADDSSGHWPHGHRLDLHSDA